MSVAPGADRKSGPRLVLRYLGSPLLGAVGVTCIDALVLIPVLGVSWRPTLVLVMLLEGGLGLLAGTGIALSSTPSIARVGETVLGTAPWSRESERNAEQVGLKWILSSCLIIAIGFGLSEL